MYKNDNINNAEIALQSGNGTTVKDKWSIYNNGIGTGDGSLRFWNTNVPGDKNALTILNNGNVGIGTASPQGILDVRGKSDINLKLGSRSGSVNIGASGGLVPLNIYGDMNIFSVPLNSPTGYYYSLVDNIISLPDPKYNDPASATFNWWKAAFPSNFSTYPDGNDGWDVVKITNSRTDSQCEDTSLVATQCSENTYRAISSAPDFVYDFSRYKEEKEGGLTNFSISYRKFKKAVSGYGGGNLNAVKGSLSGDLNVEGSVTIGNHIKISGGVEFSDGTIQTTASSRKMFTAHGKFTVPKGVTKVFVTMMSGGGGGGSGGLPNGDFGAGAAVAVAVVMVFLIRRLM